MIKMKTTPEFLEPSKIAAKLFWTLTMSTVEGKSTIKQYNYLAVQYITPLNKRITKGSSKLIRQHIAGVTQALKRKGYVDYNSTHVWITEEGRQAYERLQEINTEHRLNKHNLTSGDRVTKTRGWSPEDY